MLQYNVSIRDRRKEQMHQRTPRIQRDLFKRMGSRECCCGTENKRAKELCFCVSTRTKDQNRVRFALIFQHSKLLWVILFVYRLLNNVVNTYLQVFTCSILQAVGMPCMEFHRELQTSSIALVLL